MRIYTDGGIYDTVYMHLGTSHGNEDGWLGGGVSLPNTYDGNWHKYTMHVNWNTGLIRGWYDVENESSNNVTKQWIAGDDRIGAGTRPSYFIIQGNFSTKSPTEMTYHALDDIEVWD